MCLNKNSKISSTTAKQVNQSDFVATRRIRKTGALALRWSFGPLTKVPLSILAIPGSHDSCSYCINGESELSQDNEAFIVLILLGKFGKVLSARWSRTQDVSLSEQLAAGIRYFDFRVILREVDGLFYFVHGQFAKEVSTELLSIRSFLQEHPKEVVLLDFNHLYSFSNPDSVSLLENTIVKVFSSMLVPRSERIPSLNDLWGGAFQVICFLHAQTESPVMWTCEKISSPWPNTVNVDNLIAFLNSHPPIDLDSFHVTQGVLTPTSDYVLSNMNSALTALAASAGQRVIEWLTGEAGRRNVVMIDFAVQMFPQFARTVISMNTSRLL
ncbi:PI-PLC X domain-containing protein 2 [Taenia crassiceps]|uniref:PI-PLC X domain-containing protein 2 n=1 Tax=Taenia crassiceps TaxID=6207 RepID=A0ABR4QMD5_9CEST